MFGTSSIRHMEKETAMTTVQTIGGEVAGKLEQDRSLLEAAVQQGPGFSL